MAEGAFTFRVTQHEQRKGTGALDLSYWTYKIDVDTTLDSYERKKMEAIRRYSDFEYFHSVLVEEFPFCIVPPIPEKSVQGTLDKFVGSGANNKLLVYRQRALRKFLVRVGSHESLSTSPTLKEFLEMDEAQWEKRTKQPRKPAPGVVDRGIAAAIGEKFGNALARPFGSSAAATTQPGGSSFNKALTEKKVPLQVWEETRTYVGQLEASIGLLKERLEQLVKRRRDTSAALHEFQLAFTRVGEIESNMDPSANLGSALSAVGEHSGRLSSMYLEHADHEVTNVVETLMYYQGMCNAVRDALKRLQGFLAARDQLIAQVTDLMSQRDKAIQKGGQAEKVSKLDLELQQATERRDKAMQEATNVELLFKEELKKFHNEKQYDMKCLLKRFADLQLDYSTKMKASWQDLAPKVEQVKPAQ